MKIAEASAASGVSSRSLRHYEDEGLIVPGRCSNGYRDYCRSTIDQVRRVRVLLDSGLPLRLVRRVLLDAADGPELVPEIVAYRDRVAARIAGLQAQQSALDAYVTSLRPAPR